MSEWKQVGTCMILSAERGYSMAFKIGEARIFRWRKPPVAFWQRILPGHRVVEERRKAKEEERFAMHCEALERECAQAGRRLEETLMKQREEREAKSRAVEA